MNNIFSLLKMGVKNNLWLTLGYLDIIQTYRRSFLGPIWITISMAIQTITITLVYGAIFGLSTREYGAYIVCGMIMWTWIAAMLTEMGSAFQVYAGYIKTKNIEKDVLVWSMAYKHFIIFLHNCVVFVFCIIFGVIDLSINHLWLLITIPLQFLLTIPIIGALSIIYARYRDIQRVMTSLLTLVVILTPIFWMPSMLTGWRTIFYQYNPFYYMVEFIRAPMMGKPMTLTRMIPFLIILITAWLSGGLFYKKYKSKIIYKKF